MAPMMTAEKLPSPHGGFAGMQLSTLPTSRTHQPHYCATVLQEALNLHNLVDTHQKGVSGASYSVYVNIAKRLDECHTTYHGRKELLLPDLRRLCKYQHRLLSRIGTTIGRWRFSSCDNITTTLMIAPTQQSPQASTPRSSKVLRRKYTFDFWAPTCQGTKVKVFLTSFYAPRQ